MTAQHLHVNLLSLPNPDKSKAAYYETSLKLKAQQLFKKIEEIKLKGEPTFSYKLFDDVSGPVKEEVGQNGYIGFICGWLQSL